ncbi:hypothetical protein C8R41DRAFT_816918 [Lentinula lateritia]|uniref:Uncharacterized protein n=1 Tax=Lentinula lateritia TaxID=40482 RepID=A0ABQ8VRI2_9AGAR|nr:hypothetical protein C8R41DRAFT_816918 [Lentinula lateritia]
MIGPISTGIIYCSGPFITPVITRYPYHKCNSMYVGTILCWVSLFAASYTTKVIQLVALQGALYAIGGSLLYIPCMSYLSDNELASFLCERERKESNGHSNQPI